MSVSDESGRIVEHACKVCGDRASGRHYGVQSCDGCRGFFKRSIRRNLQYVCKDNGECIVDVSRRNQCQACRFKKCLQVNMKRDAVQHERAPRSGLERKRHCTSDVDDADSRHHQSFLRNGESAQHLHHNKISKPVALPVTSSGFAGTGAAGSSIIPLSAYSLNPNRITAAGFSAAAAAALYGGYNFPMFPYYASIAPKAPKQTSGISEIFITQPSQTAADESHQVLSPSNQPTDGSTSNTGLSCSSGSDRRAVGSSKLSPTTDLRLVKRENLYEYAARSIFLCIKWAKSLPSFVQIPLRDQMILLEETWTNLFLLSLAQFPSNFHEGGVQASLITSSDVLNERIVNIIQTVTDLNMDSMEFTFLKTIALLNPAVVNISNRKLVKSLQDQAILMLQDYCSRPTTDRARYGRILVILLSTMTVNRSTIEEIFFYSTIGRIPIQRLISEIFVTS